MSAWKNDKLSLASMVAGRICVGISYIHPKKWNIWRSVTGTEKMYADSTAKYKSTCMRTYEKSQNPWNEE